jgi:hypothetical protein
VLRLRADLSIQGSPARAGGELRARAQPIKRGRCERVYDQLPIGRLDTASLETYADGVLAQHKHYSGARKPGTSDVDRLEIIAEAVLELAEKLRPRFTTRALGSDGRPGNIPCLQAAGFRLYDTRRAGNRDWASAFIRHGEKRESPPEFAEVTCGLVDQADLLTSG